MLSHFARRRIFREGDLKEYHLSAVSIQLATREKIDMFGKKLHERNNKLMTCTIVDWTSKSKITTYEYTSSNKRVNFLYYVLLR
jgi:hypothetical protein